MDVNPGTLDQIVFGDLCPWNRPDRSELYYKEMKDSLKWEKTDFPFRFSFDFSRPFNEKTKYFYQLIWNQILIEVPRIYKIIDEDRTEDLVLYWINRTLDKCLKSRLKKIGHIIEVKKFYLVNLNYTNSFFGENKDHVANSYAIQLLRYAYIKIYLEIQEAFSEWIEHPLDFEDLFILSFAETIPENQFFPKNYPIKKISTEIKQKFRPERPGNASFHSFRYKEYDTAKEKLSCFFDSLKTKGFIHPDTNVFDFRRIFSGNEVTRRVVWTGTPSDLFYLVKLIYTIHQFVADLKQNQWKVTCKCFAREDGSDFAFKEFRVLKKPVLTSRALEMAVSHLA